MPLHRRPKKLLIITSSGGGGLLQTANAKEQEARANDPDLIVIRKDLLKDWAPFGSSFVRIWNQAQQGGQIFAQVLCVKGQFLCDILLYPSVFFHTLATLMKEDIDAVIDTQPIGTAAIVRALKIFNRSSGKQIRIEKVLVDLPTKAATHFFRSIKKLSKKNRSLLQLTTVAPLLDEGETAEEFWQTTCGLKDSEVHYEDPYVRQAFRKMKGEPRSQLDSEIRIEMKIEEERELIRQALLPAKRQARFAPHELYIPLEPHVKVISILLGSQPAKVSTLRYVKQWALLAQEHPEKDIVLFVFCGDHRPKENTLLRQVALCVASLPHYPQNLSVVPLSFQNEQVIASVFHRSDVTCTRSGGQTAMELMCVSTGEIWVHSEAKEGQDLLSGIPGWEAASAVYLQKLYKAKIVTPDLMLPHARHILAG